MEDQQFIALILWGFGAFALASALGFVFSAGAFFITLATFFGFVGWLVYHKREED